MEVWNFYCAIIFNGRVPVTGKVPGLLWYGCAKVRTFLIFGAILVCLAHAAASGFAFLAGFSIMQRCMALPGQYRGGVGALCGVQDSRLGVDIFSV